MTYALFYSPNPQVATATDYRRPNLSTVHLAHNEEQDRPCWSGTHTRPRAEAAALNQKPICCHQIGGAPISFIRLCIYAQNEFVRHSKLFAYGRDDGQQLCALPYTVALRRVRRMPHVSPETRTISACTVATSLRVIPRSVHPGGLCVARPMSLLKSSWLQA